MIELPKNRHTWIHARAGIKTEQELLFKSEYFLYQNDGKMISTLQRYNTSEVNISSRGFLLTLNRQMVWRSPVITMERV